MYGYTIFVLTAAMAIACVAYAGVARSRFWPVGEWLAADASVPKICGFVAIIWALVKSFIEFQWWSPIVILIAGWFVAFGLVFAMRKYVQWLIIPGVFVMFMLTVLYISERRPLGFISKLVG